MYSTDREGNIKKWDTATGQCLKTVYAEIWSNFGAMQVRGKVLYTGLRDGTVKLWDAETLELLTILRGH